MLNTHYIVIGVILILGGVAYGASASQSLEQTASVPYTTGTTITHDPREDSLPLRPSPTTAAIEDNDSAPNKADSNQTPAPTATDGSQPIPTLTHRVETDPIPVPTQLTMRNGGEEFDNTTPTVTLTPPDYMRD